MPLTREEANRLKIAVRIAGASPLQQELRLVRQISSREVADLLAIVDRETAPQVPAGKPEKPGP